MEKVYLQTYSLGSAMRDDFMGSLEKYLRSVIPVWNLLAVMVIWKPVS